MCQFVDDCIAYDAECNQIDNSDLKIPPICFLKTDKLLIRCIGEDRKQHYCKPDSDVTECGKKILRKKLQPEDCRLFSCYKCTF